MKIPYGISTNYQKQKYTNNKTKNVDLYKSIEQLNIKITKEQINNSSSILKYVVIPSQLIECDKIDIDEKYEKDILNHGFLNSILIKSENKKIIFVDFSLLDLNIAKKHKMVIPTIILDYDDLFPNGFEIKSNDVLIKIVKDKKHQEILKNTVTLNTTIEEEKEVTTNPLEKIDSYYNQTSKTKLQYAKRNMP